MNIRSKNGKVLAVKLLKQEVTILISAQGICEIVRKTLAGEVVGDAAAKAKDGIETVLSILTAEPPEKLIPTE